MGLTDGNLSRHLTVLEEAGLVTIEKRFEGKKPRTWIGAMKEGRRAFAGHLAALQDLIDRSGGVKGNSDD
jgi:DNA-binding transcriptional ArsR family regulator